MYEDTYHWTDNDDNKKNSYNNNNNCTTPPATLKKSHIAAQVYQFRSKTRILSHFKLLVSKKPLAN